MFLHLVCVCVRGSSLTAASPAPAADTAKKNLSAFCSDMLDEYLENEGKLLEQQSSCSFPQPHVEPVAYQLPTSSCSYVRTLDSILQLKQKQQQPAPPATAATSQLLSDFVPPSRRPKVTPKETKMASKRKAPRQTTTLDQDVDLDLQQEQLSAFRRRRRRRRLTALPPSGAPDHLAPLESDSELLEQSEGAAGSASGGSGGGDGEPGMTRALLKQQDLEDTVVWEGRPRTSITEQRASVALTSLFTLTVSHNQKLLLVLLPLLLLLREEKLQWGLEEEAAAVRGHLHRVSRSATGGARIHIANQFHQSSPFGLI